MSRFILKLLLFLSPLVGLILLTLFFVPINFYYFRCWEALQPKRLFNLFPGPFYPSITLSMTEKGDLAPHTTLAVAKDVVWQTDKYGQRTSNNSDSYDVVIVGDSNVVGTGLTQSDILSEVLMKKTNLSVYPYYAPGGLETFLRDPRFVDKKPKVLIFVQMERGLTGITPPDGRVMSKNSFADFQEKLKTNQFVEFLVTLVDRTFDPVMLRYFQQKITHKTLPPNYAYAHDQMLFLQGEMVNQEVPLDQIDQSVDALVTYKQLFSDLNIKFIFLPVPNKENIYYRMMPSQHQPTVLKTFIAALKKKQVDVVDTQTLFETAYEKKHLQLYHYDDTHWNKLGVALTAETLANQLGQLKK